MADMDKVNEALSFPSVERVTANPTMGFSRDTMPRNKTTPTTNGSVLQNNLQNAMRQMRQTINAYKNGGMGAAQSNAPTDAATPKGLSSYMNFKKEATTAAPQAAAPSVPTEIPNAPQNAAQTTAPQVQTAPQQPIINHEDVLAKFGFKRSTDKRTPSSYQRNGRTILLPDGVNLDDADSVENAIKSENDAFDMLEDIYGGEL